MPVRFVRGELPFPVNSLRRAGRFRAPALHDALWWVLAAILASLAAAIVWAIVTPVSPLGNWQPVSVRVMAPQQRAALFAAFDPFGRAAPGAAPVPAGQSGTVTSLPLTLYATRSTPGGGGSAIIGGADGVQQVYRTGAEVMPGVTLASVAFDHVMLSRDGAQEALYLDQSREAPSAEGMVEDGGAPSEDGSGGAGIPVPGTPVPGEPAPSEPAPGNPEDGGGPSRPITLDAAREGIGFAPRAEGGRMTGLQVQAQGDGSAFRAAGFRPGDVITAVGGRPVNGPDDTAALAGALRPGNSVSVTVTRGGRQVPLSLTLAQ